MNNVSTLARISTACWANSRPVRPNRNSRTLARQARSKNGGIGCLIASRSIIALSDHRRPFMDEWGQTLLIAAIIIVLGWFTLGLTWNLRKGNALLRWMQAGLPQLGERTTMRWLGSSAVELVIGKARSPFKQVTLLVVMEPRDIPWFWVLARLHHRRDMLIVRAQLQAAPPYEFDLSAPDAWSETKPSSQPEARQWAIE